MTGPRAPRPGERRSEDGEDAADLALDDDVSLPALDGEANADEPAEGDLAPDEAEESVGLDDAIAEDAAEAVIETIADVETESWETAEDDPVEDDAALEDGDEHGWTDGSDEDEGTPLDLEDPGDAGGPADVGEEGLDDDARPNEELELPPLRRGEPDEEYPDEDQI